MTSVSNFSIQLPEQPLPISKPWLTSPSRQPTLTCRPLRAYIISLLPNLTDPADVKQVLDHCKIDYDVSIPPLQDAIGSLQGDHFYEADISAGMAGQNVHDCDRVIKIGPPPPGLLEKSTRVVQVSYSR
ncbi:hypothetical protein ACOSQ2_030363 [Xanthoceras sorbifolium]